MNKLSILLLFILIGFGVKAQPVINVAALNADPGEVACIDFTVENFVDIVSIQYTMQWDPTVLQFNSVDNYGLPGLNSANFGTTITNEGRLTFSYLNLTLEPVTIPDGDLIYTVCYEVIGSIGNSSPVAITSVPTVVEVISGNTSAGDIGIDPTSGGGQIVVGDPLQLCAAQVQTQPGNTVCVPVTSDNFTDINGFQFSIHYDPSVLTYSNFSNVDPGISNLVASGSGGDIAASWFQTLGQGITLPPGSVLFEICFTATGSIGQISDIIFDGVPTSIEVTAIPTGSTNIGLSTKSGSVEITDAPADLIINASTHNENIGNNVCVDVTVSDFEDMVSMQYSINWDPGVLEFTNIVNNNLVGNSININTGGAAVGDATVSWFSNGAPVTIPDNSVIFQMCFDVIGFGGDCSVIDISGVPLFIEVVKNNGGGNTFVNLDKTTGYVCVIPDPFVLADTTIFHIDCDNEFGTIDVEYGGGVPPFTAMWSHGPTTFDVSNLPAGIYTTNVMDSVDSSFTHTFEVIDYTIDPGNCDDNDCTNGVETWDGCECTVGNPPVEPTTCDDGDCTNGVEFWDGCECAAGTPPVDPGNCNDGDCTNGIEGWDGCNCVIIETTVVGCTNPSATNYNSAATCEDGSCVFPCPDPGTCDDSDCTNGIETWDGNLCECVAGTAPIDPGCNDNDCTNGIESWDGCECIAGTAPIDPGCDDNDCTNGIETWDGCDCIAGTAPVDPGCNDNDCTNGIETWDGCDCVAGTAPIDPGTCDDGDCTNGIEEWNGCECVVTSMPVQGCTNNTATNYDPLATCEDGSCVFPCPDPGTCDDGDCLNGLETWDGDTCDCIAGTAPVDPGCNDNDCTNGIETWDGCDCVAGTAPIDPGTCDDGDCTNGIEEWDGCECVVTSMPVQGCTNNTATNYDPLATCEDGSCVFPCPDPGTCDDGDCLNGLEVWDGVACECVAGTAPVDPGCDDGDCTNGIETWDGCDCVAGTAPIDPGTCDDGDCTNGIEEWDGCECVVTSMPVQGCTNNTATNYDPLATCEDGSCVFPCPDPGTCDDGDCLNGLETWDGDTCECVTGTAPVDPGCDDGDCTNGIETWDGCDCVAGTAPIDPGTCDDGDCTNGIEEWDGCECVVTSMPIQGCTNNTATNYDPLATCEDGSCVFPCPDPGTCDDGDCLNGLEIWDGVACECVAGTAPVDPGCDDGDCTNGIEGWDGCDCIAGTAPIDPGTCDDGDCTNGIEGWDGCECVVIEMPVLGCTDPNAMNFDPLATCDDSSCIDPCPDPGTCDDGDCANGLEAWDDNLCECIIAQSVNLITPNVATTFNYCQGETTPNIELENATTGYAINWYDENMTLLFVGDQFNPAIDGNYFVGLEEMASSCEGDLVAFAVAEVAAPIAIADGGGELNCLIPELTLSGAGSNSGNGFTTTWTTTNGSISSGQNSLSPTVTDAGDYLLTVVDTTTMCISEAFVSVTENFEQPIATANTTENIGCDLSIVLDASNSTNIGNLTYQWTTIGGNILNGANTLTPEVNESGTYELVITNNDNFCTAMTTVIVSGTPPISGAIAGMDEVLCTSNAAVLEGELFSTMTGVWTIPNNGTTISDITDPNASINNLAPGDNVFVWTVSTADCPEYDQDTVVVTVEEIPVTNDDYFEMEAGTLHENFNVGLNDEFSNIDNWSFSFTSNPQDGFVTFPGGGIISFDIPDNIYGEQQFTYEICNDFCLEYCDSASVIINVLDPNIVIDTTSYFPNTITPNDDGHNDFFVLDVLLENPDKYPDNELIIFNRWGNVVYQAQPYNNDWNGVNSKGFDLPQGTYFYVVRLDISEGDILRGDITILK